MRSLPWFWVGAAEAPTLGLLATPAVLLRSHSYGETSRILRFYTRDAGLVGAVARGIKTRGSRGKGSVESLSVGILSAFVKPGRDLQTFKDFSPDPHLTAGSWDPVALSGGAILAEMVLRHAGEDANPELFQALVEGLGAVSSPPRGFELTPVILTQGWSLVAALGYQPELGVCVACGRALESERDPMRFDFSAGGLRCPECSVGVTGPRLARATRMDLVRMTHGVLPEGALTRPAAHLALLDDFVTYHVSGGQPMKAFGVLRAFLEVRGG